MMNAPQTALSRAPTALLARFARIPSSSSLSIPLCQRSLRRFSQCRPVFATQEKVQSTSPYQPYPLNSPTSSQKQPRTDPIPETSISSPVPAVHETRPPQQPKSTTASESSSTTEPKANAALTEQEAQKPKPSPPKRKFRPRKAAMKLTSPAVEQLRDLLNQPEPKIIKVGVRNRGCSGLAYHLEYVDKPGAFDEEVEQDGVKVLIDSKALFSIIGSEMDWVEDKLSQRFVFRNPNIKEECGCGESFMV
jgi:iron-sulfur cluster assembly accessory protein